MLIEIFILIRRKNRHVKMADIIKDKPVQPVILAEPAWTAARGHKECGSFRLKTLLSYKPYNITGSNNRGDALFP